MDIMENQGRTLTDHPRMIAAGELFGGRLSIAYMPFGDRFHWMCRALHTHFQPTAAGTYQPLQMLNVKNLILDILDDPCNFQNHVMSYNATVITKVTYSSNAPTSAADPQVIEMCQLRKQSDVDIGPLFMRYMLENGDYHGLTEDETASLDDSLFRAGTNAVRSFYYPKTSLWLKLGVKLPQ
ncbi:hypothetical protein BDR06DRAFT_972821 [Suillus hirtellus]|nr:hypothetical protein BDR06DRAFT_972821 [Suillus hirtellus]